MNAKSAYKQAYRLARTMGIVNCEEYQLHDIRIELTRYFDAVIAANVMLAHWHKRDYNESKYLFGLKALADKAYDYFRSINGFHEVSFVINNAYSFSIDIQRMESKFMQQHGGYRLSQTEIDQLMDIRHKAWLRHCDKQYFNQFSK